MLPSAVWQFSQCLNLPCWRETPCDTERDGEVKQRGISVCLQGGKQPGVLRVGELHPAGKLLKTESKQIKIALGSL